MLTIFTIGHSNRSLEALIAVLETAHINTLVDIRAYPISTRHPHFDSKPLRETLGVHGIIYHWAGRQLGGYRKPALSSIHSSLTNSSMRAFADHMDTDVFQQGAARLIKLARTSNICLMRAERMPSDCHRRLSITPEHSCRTPTASGPTGRTPAAPLRQEGAGAFSLWPPNPKRIIN